MRRPPELAQVAALGLIQGVAELLPVSSSAHIAAVPQLLGWEVAEWDAARRKELEVALHAGAALALAPELLRLLPDAKTLALSLAPPVIVGGLFERVIEERMGDLVAGLLLGATALALADQVPGKGSPRDPGLFLGLAQAAALVPGVSRSGATLAVARALGYSRAEATRLSFGVAGPVLVGATALKAWRGRRTADRKLVGAGVAASFVGTRAALKLFGLERGALWPFALERVVLAALVRYRRRA
ncbi:undecaprenyl-diphosphate phosphatase [Solirubrobacter taibaiensis]|nr:undecaprenyl-diphosphate phosphatase [Solirubrobacter taibaiensis]